MRKTFTVSAVIIILLAILLPVTAAASTSPTNGTAIRTAEEFLNMKSGDSYYLDADITVGETIKNAFYGELNGNGHTITTTCPLFNDFNGTVRNLTIDGTVSVSVSGGALAVKVTKTAVLWNVTNNSSVTVSKNGPYGGGLIGGGASGSKIYFYNCVNNGNVTGKNNAANLQLGGLVGYCDSIYCYNCVNNGKIKSSGNSSSVGGICGIAVVSVSNSYLDFEYCANNGEIISGGEAGGLCAHAGCANNISPVGYKIYFCENHASVTGNGTYTGGLLGYGYGTEGAECIDMFCCVNTGAITGGATSGNGFISQLACYCNSKYNKIKYCIAAGSTEIGKKNTGFIVFLGTSSQSAMTNTVYISDNYYLKGTKPDWYGYAAAESNADKRIQWELALANGFVIETTEKALQSGELCMSINRSTGFNYFNQRLGTDNCPTPSLNAPYVVYDLSVEEDAYINSDKPRLPLDDTLTYPVDPEAPVTPDTESETTAPDTTPFFPVDTTSDASENTEKPSSGGCGSCAAVSIIIPMMLIGSAFIKKKD